VTEKTGAPIIRRAGGLGGRQPAFQAIGQAILGICWQCPSPTGRCVDELAPVPLAGAFHLRGHSFSTRFRCLIVSLMRGGAAGGTVQGGGQRHSDGPDGSRTRVRAVRLAEALAVAPPGVSGRIALVVFGLALDVGAH
jgi:hypothetical protein